MIEQRVLKKIEEKIQNQLDRLGLMYRLFSRVKDKTSLQAKLEKVPGKYSSDGKKIQDVFGFRIAIYFQDDESIICDALKKIFTYHAEASAIDDHKDNIFEATRCNLIFTIPEEFSDESHLLNNVLECDKTFEVQVRTILSEGWHEVEHDLRYKHPSDWENDNELIRAFNGIYASLETSDWSMIKVLDTLAHSSYKNNKFEAMLRNKFRLRIHATTALSEDIKELLSQKKELRKNIYMTDRNDFLKKIIDSKEEFKFPVNLNNLIYILNHLYINDSELSRLTPIPLKNDFNDFL